MAITTLSGAESGLTLPTFCSKAISPTVGSLRPFSWFYLGGNPPAAAAPTPGLSGAALTSYAGQLPFTNPASGNTYLSRFHSGCGRSTQVWLCDRLWHNSGITITSTAGQTINSVAWPARDANGSTNGDEVYIGVEVSSATGAGTPTLTVAYTNSAGTTTRTGTNILATVASSVAGSFYPIGLNAGDVGVRSVQTFTLSATWTSGTIHLVAFRVIAILPMEGWSAGNGMADAVQLGFPRLYNDSVPFLLTIPQSTTASNLTAGVYYSQG